MQTDGCLGEPVSTFLMGSGKLFAKKTLPYANVENVKSVSHILFVYLGSTHHVHTFNQTGVYQLYCNKNCSRLLATITVLSNGTETVEEASHKEIIYAHAVVMVLTFAAILPLGALLANLKKPIIHMIVQPLGLVLAIIGLLLAVVYKELNESTHFDTLHTIFGLILMVVAVLALPALKFSVMSPVREKWKKLVTLWHKRLGLVAVFSGIFNIFLVNNSSSYCCCPCHCC